MPPGGGIVPRYALQLLLSKSHKFAKNSRTAKATEKNKHRYGILRILEYF
jgi:hypothetical protein